jgi:cobalamin biosynthesis Mg chelatase CobN
VLALLAFSAFPVLAQADNDSSGVEYNPALPNAEGTGSSHDEQIAKSSESPGSGGAEAPAGSGSTGSGEGSYTAGNPSGSESSGATTGSGGGTGQGSPDKGATPPADAGLQAADPAASPSTPSDDSGSSPLVPVLIAILALAGVSIGAVMIRQRRHRNGAGHSLSTKAG